MASSVSTSPLFRIFAVAIPFLVTALPSGAAVSYDFDLDYSYVGTAQTKIDGMGKRDNSDVAEQRAVMRLEASFLKSSLLWRVGLEREQYAFTLSGGPLPNTLQTTSLLFGFDARLGDHWVMRFKSSPGFSNSYGDFDRQSFNVPFVIGGAYIVNPDLQWILGLSVNINNRIPVLPGVGVRWRFADEWTLNAIFPEPRLEYEYSKALTIYGGASFSGGNFRVDSRFGTANGNPALNNAMMSYTEIRTGVGAAWKMAPGFALELEGGYMPYRKFDFFRAGPTMKTREGAPYLKVAISGSF